MARDIATESSPNQPFAERVLMHAHGRAVATARNIAAPDGGNVVASERLKAVQMVRDLWDLAYQAERGDEKARRQLNDTMRDVVAQANQKRELEARLKSHSLSDGERAAIEGALRALPWGDREVFTCAQLLNSDSMVLTAAEHTEREQTLPSASDQMRAAIKSLLEGRSMEEQKTQLAALKEAAQKMRISILTTVHPTNYRSVDGRRMEQQQAAVATQYSEYPPEELAGALKPSVPTDDNGFTSGMRAAMDAVWDQTGLRAPGDDSPIRTLTPHGKAQTSFDAELVTDQEAWEGILNNYALSLEGMLEGLMEAKKDFPRHAAALGEIADTLHARRDEMLEARRWVGADRDGRANSDHETLRRLTNLDEISNTMRMMGSDAQATVRPKADMRQNSEIHRESIGYILRYRLQEEGPGGDMADWLVRHGFTPDFDLITANDPRLEARFYSELINTRHFRLLNGFSFDNQEQVLMPLRRVIEQDKKFNPDGSLTKDARSEHFQTLVDMRLKEVIESFRCLKTAAERCGPYGDASAPIDRYQIANFETPADYLAVMALMKETGVITMSYAPTGGRTAGGRPQYTARVESAKVAIQPLFETVADLQAAPETIAAIRGDAFYELDNGTHVRLPSASLVECLRESRARQLGVPVEEVPENEGMPIMQGYSDSGKNDGYFAAQWNLYQVGRHGRVLHGFGQREARGGAFDVPGLLAQIMNPAIAESGVFDFTVQGHQMVDVASSHQGTQFLASAMTGMLSAMTQAKTRDKGLSTEPFPYDAGSPQHALMEDIAAMASEHYRRIVVNDAEAASAFINNVPGNKAISTRPTIRFSSSKNAWDKNRAIGVEYGGYTGGLPIQMLGNGEALMQAAESRDGLCMLQSMYQESPLVRAIVERMARDIGRNFQPELARDYAATIEQAGNPGVAAFVENGIASLTRLEKALGQIRGQKVERFQPEPRLKEVIGTMAQSLRLALAQDHAAHGKPGAGSLQERALNEATAAVVTAYHDPRPQDMAWAHQQALGNKWYAGQSLQIA